MNKAISRLSATFLSALTLTGCASIVSDSNYPVSIRSTPSEAKFLVENSKGEEIHSGRTPSTVSLAAGDGYFSSADYKVRFLKDGYEEKVTILEADMDGWYIGNLLFGGPIGFLAIDPATGAMWKLPESVSLSLDPISNQSLSQTEDSTQP